MLRLGGRKADGWIPSLGILSPDELRAGNERIDAAGEAAGRDPRKIRRVLNLQGVIGESRAPPSERLPVGYLRAKPLAGPPERWAETLNAFAEDGFDTLVFWPVDPSPQQVELLANEVVPLLSDYTPDRGGSPR
jgi:alkanesulfonate monooxygenase SsuD/methylene tetrahydromethanopterin reductase-like flavin-dependent oxidoreductase (luciferase family)